MLDAGCGCLAVLFLLSTPNGCALLVLESTWIRRENMLGKDDVNLGNFMKISFTGKFSVWLL